jgi:hypothetical protein
MLEAHPKGCTVQIAPHVNKELKGQCHEIFCFWFFHESVSPQPQNIPLRLFKNFSKFAEIFASQGAPPVSRYQRHQWQICQRCQRHRQQNCRRYQIHRRQICHRYLRHPRQIFPPVSLALLIPVVNLPPVANNGNNYQTADK